MSYRIHDPHQLETEIQRIARSELGAALQTLDEPEYDRHKAIHQARKCFKRIRALLRLVHTGLGRHRFQHENNYFRDLGRTLSYLRDAEAMIETFDRLQALFPAPMSTPALHQLRAQLIERRETLSNRDNHLEQTLAQLTLDLKQAHTRVNEWSLKSTGWKSLRDGVHQIYAQGRERMLLTHKHSSDENLHEWRKRVKALWYHATLLQGSWPPIMSASASTLDLLSDYLGEEHDITIFRQLISTEGENLGHSDTLQTLSQLLAQEQQRLRDEAWRLGRRVYAEKPNPYSQRLCHYWQAWRDDPQNTTNES